MKNITKALTLAAMAALMAVAAKATVIEGTTPSGQFRTVGLDSSGRFQVAIGSATLAHVIVDSGTVTANQGGPWTVAATQSGAWTFTATTGGSFVVRASTASSLSSGSILCNGSCNILSANASRAQSIICNDGDGGNLRVGGSSGPTLYPGGCFSPDMPASFIGAITGYSTAPVTATYVEITY